MTITTVNCRARNIINIIRRYEAKLSFKLHLTAADAVNANRSMGTFCVYLLSTGTRNGRRCNNGSYLFSFFVITTTTTCSLTHTFDYSLLPATLRKRPRTTNIMPMFAALTQRGTQRWNDGRYSILGRRRAARKKVCCVVISSYASWFCLETTLACHPHCR